MDKSFVEPIKEWETNYKSFDIRDSEERIVVCVNNEDHKWGFDDYASRHLEVGKLYTVDRVDVHDWHTRVSVKEIPNMWFNSVAFEELA
ncbi:MAG: hypothetical protein RR365_10810 [Bacteroides sp.]